MISIKEHDKPKLPICKMSCDVKLHDKLDDYELTKCAFQKHRTTAIIGKPGEGKSSLIYSFLKSRKVLSKCFTRIYYVAPANSIASMEDNIFSKLPDNQVFNELNGDVLDEIIDYCKNSETDEKIAIIIDDMASSLKDYQVQKALKHIAMNKRHYHIFQTNIMSQTRKSVPMEVRRHNDNIF
jgi:ABC-type glutathione transport system ATPase component